MIKKRIMKRIIRRIKEKYTDCLGEYNNKNKECVNYVKLKKDEECLLCKDIYDILQD